MSANKDGGTAFPAVVEVESLAKKDGPIYLQNTAGMSLRAWFAGQYALTASMLVHDRNPVMHTAEKQEAELEAMIEKIVAMQLRIADKAIAELAKEEKKPSIQDEIASELESLRADSAQLERMVNAINAAWPEFKSIMGSDADHAEAALTAMLANGKEPK